VRAGPRLLAPLLLAASAAHPAIALAQESDGAYGRLDGDMLFVGAAGVGVEAGGPVLETHVSLSYLSTAGPYVRYTEGFGQEELRTARSIGFGMELRPLFLGRYALDLEQGPAHLDLFADSFTLIAGMFWAAPSTGPDAYELYLEPGLELGVGLGVPLLPSGSGPYVGVQALARWPGEHLVGRSDADFLDRGALLIFTLAWQQIFDSGLVDFRDSRAGR
jgi:hypothetical protein